MAVSIFCSWNKISLCKLYGRSCKQSITQIQMFEHQNMFAMQSYVHFQCRWRKYILGNLFCWCISFPQRLLLYSSVKWRKGEMNADYLNAFYNRKAYKSAQIVFEEESKTVFWNNRQTCSSTWRWLRTCNILPTEEKKYGRLEQKARVTSRAIPFCSNPPFELMN